MDMRNEIPVGTVCRIREWDDMESEYGSSGARIRIEEDNMPFVLRMRKLCGHKFTIKEVTTNHAKTAIVYRSEERVEDEPGMNYGFWYITKGMLEIINYSEDDENACEIPDLNELFA